MYYQIKPSLSYRPKQNDKKQKLSQQEHQNSSSTTIGKGKKILLLSSDESHKTSEQTTILHLQDQIKLLENEKQNWIAFQAYFESQLAKFSQYTSVEDFSSFIYTLNKVKANNSTPTQESQRLITNSTQDKNQSTTIFNTRSTSQNHFSESPQKTHFTISVLKDSQEQFIKFQKQFNNILQMSKQSPQKKNMNQSAMIKQIQILFEEMIAFYNQMTNLQAKEDESIQDLIRKNLLLEKQISLLMNGKPKSKIPSAIITPTQLVDNKDLEKQIIKSKRLASETKEETEIYQITTELLSSQIDQLNEQIFQLMEENSKLKGQNEKLQIVYQQEVQTHQNQKKEHQSNLKDLSQQLEKVKSELEVAKQNTRTQCNIIIHKVDDHHLYSCEQPIVTQETNQQLEQQLSQLRKALITLDKESKEKEIEVKNYQDQIQNLQQQIEANQDKLKEKIQENTTYLTQIHELNKMQVQAKLHRAVITQFQEENERLKLQNKTLSDQMGTFLSVEQETRKRQQSTLKKENTLSNLHKEITRLMDELRNTQETLAKRIIDNQNQQIMISQISLQKDQLQAEIIELTKQLQNKKVSLTTTIIVNEDSTNNDEFQRIHQENRQKMVQMKSKLLGLKTNIEKHGEKVGVLSKTTGKTPSEIAKETEYQNQLIIQELMVLIDQINELQKKIDQDYESNFAKMNEKQRTLVQQNMQLKQELKKFQNMESEIKLKNEEILKLNDQLKMITIEYREYQDIMRSKISYLQKDQKKEIKAEISPEDIERHKNLKEMEKLQHLLNDKEQEINMLKEELKNRQQQAASIPPEIMQQLQQMNMMMMQEDSMVRNAARTIQQNNLEVKQADILHRKINELTEKLSNKNLETQKFKQEKQNLEERFKQEKQEWLNQIEKREKQYQVLETKYKKCLEQYEVLQQQYFKLEEQLTKMDSGVQNENERDKTQESDSD